MQATHSSMPSEKQGIRDRIRTLRSARSQEDLKLASAGFTAQVQGFFDSLAAPPQTVTAFVPFGQEPPILGLLERLANDGVNVFVPVCEPQRQLSWVRWFPGVPLQPGLWAPLLEPVGDRFSLAQVAPEVMLVPGLALDLAGNRLGQGAGYYDRALATLDPAQRPVLAGIVYSSEVFEAGTLPADPWDLPLEYVVSEEFFRRLNG